MTCIIVVPRPCFLNILALSSRMTSKLFKQLYIKYIHFIKQWQMCKSIVKKSFRLISIRLQYRNTRKISNLILFNVSIADLAPEFWREKKTYASSLCITKISLLLIYIYFCFITDGSVVSMLYKLGNFLGKLLYFRYKSSYTLYNNWEIKKHNLHFYWSFWTKATSLN